MRKGDGQAAAHEGIRNSGKRVETFGEVMVHIERPLVEGARAGRAETGCDRAGLRNAEVILPLLIPGESGVGFLAVSVFRACPPDLQQLSESRLLSSTPLMK